MEKKNMHPESLMMSHGYKPELSEGAVKCPIFQTSTFVFKTAEEGKSFFEVAYGLRDKSPKEELGLIYSRINNPNLEILENRLCLWDKTEDCAVFESGMSAISTVLLEFLKPGDVVLHSNPLYGGTDHFIRHFLSEYGIESLEFMPGQSAEEIGQIVESAGAQNKLKMIFVETPANPTNLLIDLEAMKSLANKFSNSEQKVLLAVDNTYMGPIWQHPTDWGADLVIYSATKYLGGHSDLIAGAVLGDSELIGRIKVTRTFLGNMIAPNTAWLLLRSLETLKVRMDRQSKSAEKVANFLKSHAKICKVYFPTLLKKDSNQFAIYSKQCVAPGAMISFEIEGGEKEAFNFLNHLKLIKLAVSLGSTESLAEHPATMTHAGVDPQLRDSIGITDNLVRVSIGVEHEEDIIADMKQALQSVKKPTPIERELLA